MKLHTKTNSAAIYAYLPSFKMGVFALGVLIALGVWTYVDRVDTVVTSKDTTKPATSPDISKLDTDKDGVTDWKEKLFGLNPLLSDSDGDGTPDATEMREMEQGFQIKQEGSALKIQKSEVLTETARLAQDGMKAVISLNQQGALNQDSINALKETAVDTIQNKAYISTYGPKDIKTVRATEDNMTEYTNKVAYIFLKEEGVFLQDAPALLKTYTMTKSPKDLEKITKMRQNVTNMGLTLLSFQTPDQLSTAAVNTIREFDKYGMLLDDLKKIDSDPVSALSAIGQFYKSRLAVTNSTTELIREAQKLGITFTSSDPGGILIEAVTK